MEVATIKYLELRQLVQHTLRQWVPLVERLDRFESFVLLTLFLFVFCWVIEKIHEMDLTDKLSPSGIKKRVFRFAVKNIWFVRNQLKKKIEEIAPTIHAAMPPECRSKIRKLPNRKPNDTNFKDESEALSLRGYLSGSRYPPKAHSDLVSELSSRFIYSNPLHFNIHPAVRQM
mgnify:FL=1